MKKLSVLMIGLLMILSSCQITSSVKPSEMMDNIVYFKDNRTGLCFASVSSHVQGTYKVVSITHVPCESVQEYLLKD